MDSQRQVVHFFCEFGVSECEGRMYQKTKAPLMPNTAVSSLGRFRSTRGIVYTPRSRVDGYVEVCVHGKLIRIHRLMAFAFALARREDQTQVNHIDLNPSNNVLSNLEFVSRSENIRHSYATNPNRKSSAAKTSKPIQARKVGTEEWRDFANRYEAASQLNIDRGNILAYFHNKRTHVNGYEFRYTTPTEGTEEDPENPGEQEEWRDVHGGVQVSSLGRIRNSYGRVHTPTPASTGYCIVNFSGKSWLMHRLIAEAFELPRASEAQIEVNHINGNRSDNRLCNLEWCTKSANIQHSHDTNENRQSKRQRAVIPLEGCKIGTDEWIPFPDGALEVQRRLGINSGNVNQVLHGKKASAGGYVFRQGDAQEPPLLEGEEWKEVDADVLKLL